MKKISIIVSVILAIGIIFSGIAFAFEPQAGPPTAQGPCMTAPFPHGPHEPPLLPGMKLILNYLQINVLAELTGLTQENVRQLLISSPPPAILDAYDVPIEAFISAMDKQTAKLVNQAAVGGVISKKQAEDILKKMTRKPARHHEE
jgi:hypothetical protein